MGNKKEKIFNNLLNLLKENQKLILPIKVSQGTVIEDWIDYSGAEYIEEDMNWDW